MREQREAAWGRPQGGARTCCGVVREQQGLEGSGVGSG